MLLGVRSAGVRAPLRKVGHHAWPADLLWSDLRVGVHGGALVHAGGVLEAEAPPLLHRDPLGGGPEVGAALPPSHRATMMAAGKRRRGAWPSSQTVCRCVPPLPSAPCL